MCNTSINRYLWHGTVSANVSSICEGGFDPARRAGQSYGPGECNPSHARHWQQLRERCHTTALTFLFYQGSISPPTAQYHTPTRKITASRSASSDAITSTSRDPCAVSAPLQRHPRTPHHKSSKQHRGRQQPDGPVTDLLIHRLATCASACAILTRPRSALSYCLPVCVVSYTTAAPTPRYTSPFTCGRATARVLFHQTTEEGAIGIMQTGFDLSRAKTKSLCGPGIYFCTHPSSSFQKSHERHGR